MLQEDFDRIFYKCLSFWRKKRKVWGTDLLDEYKDLITPVKAKIHFKPEVHVRALSALICPNSMLGTSHTHT